VTLSLVIDSQIYTLPTEAVPITIAVLVCWWRWRRAKR